MKKLLFAVFMFILFALSNVEVKSACPPGTTNMGSIQIMITDIYSNPCYFTAWFCFGYSAGPPATFLVVWDHNDYTGCIPDSTWIPLLDSIVKFRIHKAALDSISASIPDCEDDTLTSTYTMAACIYYVNEDTAAVGTVYVQRSYPCAGSITCTNVYHECWDFTQHPAVIHKELVSSTLNGTPLCDWVYPVLPPPGKTLNEPWTTPCYRNGCDW